MLELRLLRRIRRRPDDPRYIAPQRLQSPLPGATFSPMDLERRLQETMADTYRIERELGGGGMSRVFAATEIALGRRVAIKLLTELSSVVSGDRFRREIRTVARMQ